MQCISWTANNQACFLLQLSGSLAWRSGANSIYIYALLIPILVGLKLKAILLIPCKSEIIRSKILWSIRAAALGTSFKFLGAASYYTISWNKPLHYKPRFYKSKSCLITKSLWLFCKSIFEYKSTESIHYISPKRVSKCKNSPAFFVFYIFTYQCQL